MRNQQQQQPQQQQQDQEHMVSMDVHKNPNLETTQNNDHVLPSSRSSSQDLNTNHHHQHNIHISKKTREDEGVVFKNPNLLSCSLHVAHEQYLPPPPPQDFKKTHCQHNILLSNKTKENEGFTINNPNYEVIKKPNSVSCSFLAAGEGGTTAPPPAAAAVEESGRDRLKRHRVEMAGRVWIPDIWGHEDLLKDWIDCTVFDSSLGNSSIMSARAALMQEGRSTVRIENKC